MYFLTQSAQFAPILIRYSSKFAKSNLKKILETMPKEPKHIAEAQRQRLKIKEKHIKYVPGKVILQVLGTGAEGAPKALYMFTDQSRYLFNCGEGTQRLAHEHKMKLSKLEHIFITQPTWDNIGGLPGVSLTIQDVGVPQITLHGPEGLDELFIATRRFIILKDLTIRMADCNPVEKFEDNVMSVTYVPLVRFVDSSTKTKLTDEELNVEKSVQTVFETAEASTSTRKDRSRSRCLSEARSSAESSDDDTDYYAHERKRSRRRNKNRSRSRSRSRSVSGARYTPQPIPSALFHIEREQNTTMCYICRLNARPGALSLEKCVEFGVPPGPLLGQLKAGNDITLATGVVVKSKDVCLPDDPGPIIIVVDCPTVEYLDSLVNNEEFKKHQATASCDDDLAYIVVHFTASHIMQEPRYRSWVDKFSMSTQHLVLNDANRCMGSIAVHRIQHKLNMLNENMFPLLGDTGTQLGQTATNNSPPSPKKQKTDESNSKIKPCATSQMENLTVHSRPSTPDDIFVHANTFCNIHLRPKKGFDRSDELQLVPSQYLEETTSVEGFPNALKQLKEKLKYSQHLTIEEYPKVLFLGTGSCIPNKTRNTSGILLHTSENAEILLDCGEGTYGQIVRFYGPEKSQLILSNLKAIYISHLHADHHIGLLGVLKGRQKALVSLNKPHKPLLLIAPRQIMSWLHFYHRRFEQITDEFELIANGDLVMGDRKLNEGQLIDLGGQLDMSDVSTVLVRHCPNAFGVAFTHKNGWKITYSGDTMPCDRLVQLGLNSDILIHEATMEDELAHEAIAKMHSTTTQAITIGQRMNAKHILLTHFSQRYAKLPRFNDNFADNVGIAFDNMQVRLDELPFVHMLYPALRLMFAEHYEELEHKAVKRQLKAERREASLERAVVK